MTPDEVRIDQVASPPRALDGRVDVDALAESLGPDTIVLESSPGTPHAIRWSFLALPAALTVVDDGTATVLRTPTGEEPLGRDPFAAIDRVCERLGLLPDSPRATDGPPFKGGLVGGFAYDLARRIERLPDHARRDRATPQLHLTGVTTLVAVDHVEEQAWLVRRPLPGVAPLDAERVQDRLTSARVGGWGDGPAPANQVASSLGRADYLQAIEAVLDRIAAGDVFQVNLSQRLTAPWHGDAATLYRRLRQLSPAPHAALVPAIGVASISPETFLVANGRRITTRPMKGTRPRHDDRGADSAAADELATSAKDRAENVMVVDMQRNDLGRVCTEGSVSVPSLCEVEAHPTVWQLVSTITGTLEPTVGWGALLRSTLPCGSVTGAPKVAAMTLIEDHEPVRRGWYCGAIGWLGPGSLRLSVAIRTAVVTGGRADYGAGGGIVADSDPEAEYAESLAKARPFLDAVNGTLEVAA